MRNIIVKAQWYIVILLAGITGVVWFLAWQSSPVSNDKTPVRVVVPNGSTARDIAERLQEKGLIRDTLVFRLTVRVGGQGGLLKPGAYDFNKSMSIFEIIRKISSGEIAAVWVVIPEGYTIRQIGKLLEDKEIISDANAFVEEAGVRGLEYVQTAPVWRPNLEGYLFPDTYLFAPGATPSQVIKEMLSNFDRKVVDALDREVASSALAAAYTPEASSNNSAKWHTILTVAAMIEREAKLSEERPLVSAVIWNRLRKGMKLEIDATVQYAQGHHKSRLTYADLRIANPYNTYYVPGLPAGPIGNPGLDSIKAALNPAKVDYLFYVANEAKGDGSHVFTRTVDEHNKAKARVRRGR